MSAAPIVDLRAISARVGLATILRGVDFRLDAGDAVGIFGANGAGKTTLLRIIATLLPPSGGSGEVFGAPLDAPGRFDVRHRIGMIGHLPALYPELSIRENLHFVARVAGCSTDEADTVLETVGLAAAADRVVGASSHGMQRRAEFAREIMRAPDLLLLDEPHTALDPSAVELVEHVVAGVASRGGAVVVVSHDRERVAPMVQRSLQLTAGALQ
ncbi:MAG: heme ABC exporter ATP-binding protein CcmA [Acidimicrobiia bacterium]|nr:heme ABC exporter ATP-binding protein CcmA [Acidimicrobiia bacterium]